MDNLVGQNLGRYHVIEPLGQGGMAAVYKAFDTSLERHVAIKIIRGDKKEGTEQNEFLKRFQREARALAQLDHPYILKVLDYGEQDGMPYLVMPFVKGGTLREKMGKPIPYRQAAALLAPVARALEYAHERKIIHRDVTPANILISESNSPLLSDFGIAKILEGGESTQLTATGVGIGTPDYMAPEQWMGKADACTDIYSLGIVFYQMVTGRLPFTAETPAAVLIKHMQDPLPRPSSFVADLPDSVEAALYKALAKDPASRFPNMGAFAEALERLTLGEQTATVMAAQPAVPTVPGMHSAEVAQRVAAAQGPRPATGPQVQARPATGPQSSPWQTSGPQMQMPPAKKKGFPGWAIAVIIVAVIGVGLICVLGGGALIKNLAAQLQAPTNLPGVIETAIPTLENIALPTEIPVGTLPPFEATIPSGQSGSNPPFTSIEGLPEDIPVLATNNGDLMTSTSQGTTMYYFTTNVPYQQVADFYKNGMTSNGWSLDSESTQTGMVYWMFTKGDSRQVMIMVAGENEQPPIQVEIVIQ